MDAVAALFDFILHVDEHLAALIAEYGAWTYGILFAIVFAETGLVVTPLLPGDSLLFAAGALAARPDTGLNVVFLAGLLIVAAILGDTVNYWVGKAVGPRAFSSRSRFLKREYLDRTARFFEKHGGKTIVLARFIPIIRTFAPFVAGVGAMQYGRFLAYNVIGGIVWVALFLFAGFFFGNVPVVQENFSLVVLAIIALSVVPVVVELVKARRRPAEPAPLPTPDTLNRD